MGKITSTNPKEIIALDIFDAVRLRPTLYLGQIAPFEDRIPLIKNGKLIAENKIWSPGFMHLIVEILENSIDEAKRMKGKMKGISITVDLDTNRITVIDEGGGFHKAASKHPKTKKNVVRTAFEELHAGSNFKDTEDSLLGTNGVGASIVNILSKNFTVRTVNSTSYVEYEWEDFKVMKEIKKGKSEKDCKGTMVSFIPSPEVFPNFKWDEDLILTYLSFKQFLLDLDSQLKGLKLKATFVHRDKIETISITKDWIPDEHITTKNKLGYVFLWPSYENSCSLAFLNGSQCTGIQQKIVNDWVNASFEYSLAHHFYETLIVMDVPSTLMRFADQNKTKYAVEKREIEPTMEENFKFKLLKELKGSDIAKQIDQQIEDRLYSENINKIKTAQRKSKRKISEKYSPASRKKELIYITEGNCLNENQKIVILRGKKILDCKLVNIKIGDLVITHNNNLKPIESKNRSIKKAFEIKTKIGNLICSDKHQWFIYDKEKKEFYFEKTINLNKKNHQLIKNSLAFLDSFDEVIDLKDMGAKIQITNDKKEKWDITKTNKIAIFEKDKFQMTEATNLKKGDLLSRFNFQ